MINYFSECLCFAPAFDVVALFQPFGQSILKLLFSLNVKFGINFFKFIQFFSDRVRQSFQTYPSKLESNTGKIKNISREKSFVLVLGLKFKISPFSQKIVLGVIWWWETFQVSNPLFWILLSFFSKGVLFYSPSKLKYQI